jgi:erythromycin esterase
MKKYCLYVISMSIMGKFTAYGQMRDTGFPANVQSIRSIDPADDDFTDLKGLGEAMGAARIVMLGEQDHGDAATFRAKSRLIRYLHEKLGFDVLAFESDFFGLSRGWDAVTSGQYNIDSLLTENIYPVWTKCKECAFVFDYVKQQYAGSRPLIVSGFDDQLAGKWSQHNLVQDVNLLIANYADGIFASTVEKEVFTGNLTKLLEYYKGGALHTVLSVEEVGKLIIQLDSTDHSLHDAGEGNSFFRALIGSLSGACRQMIAELGKDNYQADRERDMQMASNLTWLVQHKYPEKKIIVWAANSHIMMNGSPEFRKILGKPYSMGSLFCRQPGISDSTYIIGFTGYGGTSARVFSKPYTIPRPANGSLEARMHEEGRPYSFVDFRSLRQVNTGAVFYMKCIHWKNEKAEWLPVFDGVFYIQDMWPCNVLHP